MAQINDTVPGIGSQNPEAPNGDFGFWQKFQQSDMYDEVTPDSVVTIFEDVLDTYGIDYDLDFNPFSVESFTGKLDNIDLKRVDPVSAIKASLLEVYADSDTSGIVEFAVNEHGEVYLYEVNRNESNMDVYYSIPSSTYSTNKVGVKVVGKKPMIKRVIQPWYPIINKYGADNNCTVWDSTLLNSSCVKPGVTTSAVITYKDPVLESGQSSYRNGIDNVFEMGPFQSITGYAWKVVVPDIPEMHDQVTITQQTQSVVPMLLDKDGKGILPEEIPPNYELKKGGEFPSVGNKLRRREPSNLQAPDDGCNALESEDYNPDAEALHVTVPIKEGLTYNLSRNSVVNKFMEVTSVYTVGRKITCRGIIHEMAESKVSTEHNTDVFIEPYGVSEEVVTLSPTEHYVITMGEALSNDGEEKETLSHTFDLQFANCALVNDNAKYGTGIRFYIHENSDLVKFYNDGEPIADDQMYVSGIGTVLPFGGQNGMLIKQVWCSIRLDCPNFTVIDPRGKANEIARLLNVEMTAIAIEDRPAPIAVNGQLIESEWLADSDNDNDPTTVQDFSDTVIDQVEKQMDSGRTLSLNLASLSEEQTVNLSKKLYNVMKKDVGLSYTHTCDPMSSPNLGDKGLYGGVINSITYNFDDQSRYLINVTEGPEYYGDFAGISGGFYVKKVEEVQGVGTIIQDKGDNISYKVRVDGASDVIAINSYAGVLDVGDRVNVTIHNNEVEE